MKGGSSVPPHEVEHRRKIDGGQGGVGEVFSRGGGGEENEQAENGTGGQGATEGLLKSIERGWNLLDGRKEGENTDAKAFRRREVHVPVKSERRKKNLFLTHLVLGSSALTSEVTEIESRMITGESRDCARPSAAESQCCEEMCRFYGIRTVAT